MQHAPVWRAPGTGAPDDPSPHPPRRQPGEEPFPGYRLIEPLGRGGFGEVWRCEAPGGLFKAVKFVPGTEFIDPNSPESSPASQEFAALQRVKTLRHPFLLSLERVEVVGGMLVVVMELADYNLHALFESYRAQGQAGIPRDELLGFLSEAAEALDWMNFEHGLQHLDVKPHNLFLVSGHVKVADFGLVGQLAGPEVASEDPESRGHRSGGVTPLYSPPELLRGTLSGNSDQYSLAVVYQELLTGTLPFWHESAYELMMRHLSGEPDLRALPDSDRAVVGRALAKLPSNRYPSCLEFIQALLGGQGPSLRRSGAWKRVLVGDRPAGAPAPTTPTRSPPLNLERTIFQPQTMPAPEAPPIPPDTPSPDTSQGRALPTAVSLPGFRFISCLNQSPLGDLWRAEDAEGRPRRAVCLLPFVRYDDRLICHLRALRDPALPNTEVHWSPSERLVVLTEWHERTLRDLFEECQAQGHVGVPRDQLLTLLRSAAEALDALHSRHGLDHLGLNPRCLLVEANRLCLADYGIIPLVWLPTGQSPALLNSRYAAVELFDRGPSPSSDQYSLALIYAEMLTGAHPRPQRQNSGLHRVGSGAYATRPSGKLAGRSGMSLRAWKLDLDLLPTADREVVARALANVPSDRFASCTAFVEALAQLKPEAPLAQARYDELPPVIPFATLMGEPVPANTVLPLTSELVEALATEPMEVCAGPKHRFVILPDGSREYRCPLQQLFAGARQLKLEGFRAHWQARLVDLGGDHCRLLIDVSAKRTLWERVSGRSRQLEVDIHFSSDGARAGMTEARVRVDYPESNRGKKERVLSRCAAEVFESVREYFQATAEHRNRDRVAVNHRLHVYPVLPDLDVAPTVEGQGKDVSKGGIRFWAGEEIVPEYFYLHFFDLLTARGHAILARKVRAVEAEGGWEIGAEFTGAGGGED